MHCPHCSYTDNQEDQETLHQENKGKFYKLAIELERLDPYDYYWQGRMQKETLYACPKCGKAFIEV